MSEEEAGSTSEPQINTNDNLKNVKSEFDRKLDGVMKAMSNLTETVQTMSEKQASYQAPAYQEPAAKKDIWEDPDAYVENAIKKALGNVVTKDDIRAQNAQAAQVAKLTSLYPELNDRNSDLYRKVDQSYSALSAQEQGNPYAWRTLVEDAALEAGIVPAPRRRQVNNDAFALGSDSSGGRMSDRKDAGDDLTPHELAAAELLGINIKDPKLKEELKNSKRKPGDWGKWKVQGD